MGAGYAENQQYTNLMEARQDMMQGNFGGAVMNGAQAYGWDRAGDYMRGGDDPNGGLVGRNSMQMFGGSGAGGMGMDRGMGMDHGQGQGMFGGQGAGSGGIRSFLGGRGFGGGAGGYNSGFAGPSSYNGGAGGYGGYY